MIIGCFFLNPSFDIIDFEPQCFGMPVTKLATRPVRMIWTHQARLRILYCAHMKLKKVGSAFILIWLPQCAATIDPPEAYQHQLHPKALFGWGYISESVLWADNGMKKWEFAGPQMIFLGEGLYWRLVGGGWIGLEKQIASGDSNIESCWAVFKGRAHGSDVKKQDFAQAALHFLKDVMCLIWQTHTCTARIICWKWL